jgi:translation initiation factor 2 beta subunit (eIF-2beta)/eIF-5
MPLINRDRKQTDSHYRYKMPSVEVKHEGGGQYTRTLIINLKKIAEALNTTPEFINHFLSIELGTESSCSDNSDNRLFLRGTHQANMIQDHLDKYIKIYVKCVKCNIPEGQLSVKGKNKKKSVWTYCPSCGHREDVTNSHKTSNYIKNNWEPVETESTQDTSTKKENNLKLQVMDNVSDEPEWTIGELEDDNTQPEMNGFQLPGMDCNGFQLPISNLDSFQLPVSSLGLESGSSLTLETSELKNDQDDLDKYIDVEDTSKVEPIIEYYTDEDLDLNYEHACDLVAQQCNDRRSLFINTTQPMISLYRDCSYPKFGDKSLNFIKKIAKKLDVENVIGRTIASFLFDTNIVAKSQIENYRQLLEPFLINTESQHQFLNYFLILLRMNPELISDFENIVETLLMNNLIDDYSLIEWHKKLINENDPLFLLSEWDKRYFKDESDFNLDSIKQTFFDVYQCIEPLINQMSYNDDNDNDSLLDGMTFGYQEIKIMHRQNKEGISSYSNSMMMTSTITSNQSKTFKKISHTSSSNDEETP